MKPYLRTNFTVLPLKEQDTIDDWKTTLFALEEETVFAKSVGNTIEGKINGYFTSFEYDSSTAMYAMLSKEFDAAIVVDTYNYDDEECFTQRFEAGTLVSEERLDTETTFNQKALREWLQIHQFENYDTTCINCGMYIYEYEINCESASDMGHTCE